MMYYFCTYFDKNYLPQGLSLWESLQKQIPGGFTLFVLSLDSQVKAFFEKHRFAGIKTILLEDLENQYPELLTVKKQRKTYEYYFTLTPSLPWYVLETYPEVDMITYVDADIFFYSSPKILFDELSQDSVLIIPHFFSEANKKYEEYGIYNVVFNTFKRDKNGLQCLNWWRENCIKWCYDYVEGDKFADQKYLDKFTLLFDGVKVCQNRGANLAIFNLDNSQVSFQNGIYKVNNDDLVFYHFHCLRKISQNLYNPNFLGNPVTFFKNKFINRLYLGYIKRLRFYQKKYHLSENQTERFKAELLKGRDLVRRILYEYSYLVHPMYSGVVSLSKYSKYIVKIKKALLQPFKSHGISH